jgi:phage N-6-adenine-methyltransferase
MSMPEQKPGRSKQDYGTPKEFLEAVRKRFNISDFDWDLAAHEGNHVTHNWLGRGGRAPDSFEVDWSTLQGRMRGDVHLWLNPEFGNIKPWAAKCAASTRESGVAIYFLTPASVGANWFAEHVWPYARVIALQGRLSFDGVAPFPKDCMLSVFSTVGRKTFEVWDWRKT